MIKSLLRKLGYIHESEIDEEYLLLAVAEMVGDPTDYVFDKKRDQDFFRDLSKIDGINDYLSSMLAKDMQRSFAAKDQTQRDIIHGAFARTVYIKSQIRGIKQMDREEATKLENPRYA